MDRPSGGAEISTKAPDIEELSRNIARFVEEAGKATAAGIDIALDPPRA